MCLPHPTRMSYIYYYIRRARAGALLASSRESHASGCCYISGPLLRLRAHLALRRTAQEPHLSESVNEQHENVRDAASRQRHSGNLQRVCASVRVLSDTNA